MNLAEIRYELARLHELLAMLPALLRASGITGAEADDLVRDARALDAALRGLRSEQAARLSTCASS